MLCRNRQFGISGISRKALGRAMGPASESEGQWQSKMPSFDEKFSVSRGAHAKN